MSVTLMIVHMEFCVLLRDRFSNIGYVFVDWDMSVTLMIVHMDFCVLLRDRGSIAALQK